MGGRTVVSWCDLGLAGLLWKSVQKPSYKVVTTNGLFEWISQSVQLAASEKLSSISCNNSKMCSLLLLTVSWCTVATNSWHPAFAVFWLSSFAAQPRLPAQSSRASSSPLPAYALLAASFCGTARFCKVNRLLSIRLHKVSCLRPVLTPMILL